MLSIEGIETFLGRVHSGQKLHFLRIMNFEGELFIFHLHFRLHFCFYYKIYLERYLTKKSK